MNPDPRIKSQARPLPKTPQKWKSKMDTTHIRAKVVTAVVGAAIAGAATVGISMAAAAPASAAPESTTSSATTSDTTSRSAASVDSAPGGAEPRGGALTDSPTANLDSLSDMGESTSLRLQMAMDRESKIMSALSNVVEKDGGDTAQNIIDNLK